MRLLRLLLTRIRASFRPEHVHEEISDELRFHLEMKMADLERQGVSGEAAIVEARRAFGAAARFHEQAYDLRGGGVLEQSLSDLRFAFRLQKKHWLRTLILVATLAVGFGLNTAVFGVVRSVLLQPLPFAAPESLVVIHQANHGQLSGVSYPIFLDWRNGSHSFQDMAVYASDSATYTGQGDAAIVYGAIASSSLFRVLGVSPIRGRLFLPEEDRFAAGAKATTPLLISDRFWHSRFGGRSDILGTIVHLDGRSFEVIGVVPSRLAFPIQKDAADYWKTVAVDADPSLYGGSIPLSRGYPRYDGVVARLKPGVTLSQAMVELVSLAKVIARQHPKATSSNDVAVRSALDEVVAGSSRSMILLLYAAVLCVLLVAFLNVANILFVDALARGREFSLRLSLGAPVSRLVRQLMAESVSLSLTGGSLGLLLSWLILKVFVAFAPPDTPRLSDIHLGPGIVLYVAAISISGGLFLSFLPALLTTRLHRLGKLDGNYRGISKRASLRQPASILICGQIILGMILTCCAAVLVSNFQQIVQANRGFNPHGVLTASVSLPPATYGQGSNQVLAYYRTLLQKLRTVPGVESASVSQVLPLSGQGNSTTVGIEGVPQSDKQSTDLRFVEAAYFKTLQIPLISGRVFNEADTKDRPGYAIVNQAFVRHFLHGRSPYGTKILLGWGGESAKQIVGVVADIRHMATSPLAQPEVYVPVTQFPINDMAILLRTSGDPYRLTGTLLQVVRQSDSSVPVDRVRSLDDYLILSSSEQQFLMWLLVAFASITMLLSAIGLYGVLSDSVLARSKEFGIRLALGSSILGLAGLVLRHGLKLTGLGVAVGGVCSLFASRLLRHWLYESTGADWKVLLVSSAVMTVLALATCVVPARRAASIDPASLLRAD